MNSAHRYIVVDAYYGGTGIRDYYEEEFIKLETLNLNAELLQMINNWLQQYQNQFVSERTDEQKINALDNEGLKIARTIQDLYPNKKVTYYLAFSSKTHLLF